MAYLSTVISYIIIVHLCRLSNGSREDLLAYSQAVYDQLAPLSSFFQTLCTCENGTTRCSYKQYNECKTKIKGREFHCVLHGRSTKKRDLTNVFRYKENTLKTKRFTVSTFMIILKHTFY